MGKRLKALNCLLYNTKKYCLKPKVLCQLFDTFVGSILSFSSEVWGFGKCKEIERIHLKFCKTLLKVKSSTCNMGVYGELGRYPLYISRYARIIKFWCEINETDNILINTLHDSLLNDCRMGKKNWASNVKTLLDNFGFSYVWDNPFTVNWKSFPLIFKEHVNDVFKQEWLNKISLSGSLILYKTSNSRLELRTIYMFCLSKLRINISKLRLSAHQLRIETGRYARNRLERALRLCTLCDKSDIEDEYHFVLVCPVYDSRKKYIRPFYYKRPNVFKFITLMQTNQLKVLRNLGKYLCESFALRKTLMP